MRRIATVVLLLFLVLFGAYSALWFFIADRRWGTSSQYPNFFPNLTQGSNLYTPDSSNPTFPV